MTKTKWCGCGDELTTEHEKVQGICDTCSLFCLKDMGKNKQLNINTEKKMN